LSSTEDQSFLLLGLSSDADPERPPVQRDSSCQSIVVNVLDRLYSFYCSYILGSNGEYWRSAMCSHNQFCAKPYRMTEFKVCFAPREPDFSIVNL